ncbi:MAG: RagB/SusD family nutrient uptake outer membrane protein [Dysgonamonadaceae bacterium]|jgi:hypothetical protein|nr:RagB/SusD family nutrient uptake outer membrane protein [Dysgonamonadaceae bacterium]
MKRTIILLIAAVALAKTFQSCSVEPTYYSTVEPSTFYSSEEKVYQRFTNAFQYWTTMYNYSPIWGSFTSTSGLSTDEFVMPNRNGDWYDDGYYLDHYNHKFSPAWNGEWYYYWQGFTRGTAEVFDVLDDIEKNVDFEALGMSESIRESLLNQLNVLVAYYYLMGLDAFGGVPLYTSKQDAIDELKGRATAQETFDYVETLLKEAIPLLPPKVAGAPEDGYITQGTAAALLARLYFNAEPYIGKTMWSECADICTKIINGDYGYYRLATRFQDIFGYNNSTCPEIMWTVPSQTGKLELDGGSLPWGAHYSTWQYLDNPNFMSWNGYCLTPSQDINGKHYKNEAGNLGGPFKLGCPYDKFEDTDLRKKNYIYLGSGEYEGMFIAGKMLNTKTGVAALYDGSREYTEGDTVYMVDQIAQLCPTKVYSNGRKEGALYAEENSGVRIVKFTPIPNGADNTMYYDADIPVIRLTEIVYMLAECKYNLGDKATAANLINSVRARYFTDGDPNPVTAANLDKYRLADEWLIEFIGEGRRRTDLVRWGMYTTESWWDHPADGPGKEYLNRLPITISMLEANPKLEQNPGYN